MNILAVDTSTMMSSISILSNNKIIADYSVNVDQTHSEKLIISMKRLLEDVKMSISDIDLFTVAKGPGSFTGLRIGMTSIKAIAQALDKDIIGISTLEAMAFSILNDANILAIIDARGNRYFSGLFKKVDGKLETVFEKILTEKEIINLLGEMDSLTIVGEAIEKLPQEIIESSKVTIAPSSLNCAIGRNLCALAKIKYENGERDSYFDLTPNYLRKSQAEINLGKKNEI